MRYGDLNNGDAVGGDKQGSVGADSAEMYSEAAAACTGLSLMSAIGRRFPKSGRYRFVSTVFDESRRRYLRGAQQTFMVRQMAMEGLGCAERL
jgi:hypothetical protein